MRISLKFADSKDIKGIGLFAVKLLIYFSQILDVSAKSEIGTGKISSQTGKTLK